MRRARAAILAGALIAVSGGAVRCDGQEIPRTLVRLTVKDSLGIPVADANITVLRGLKDTVVASSTDANGVRVLFVPRSGAPIQVIVRKIGFARTDRFATTEGHDSVTFGFTMKRLVTSLAQVTVTEKEDIVRKSYYIDADAIAASARPILDASDVLTKLRPDMIYSRAPKPYGVCETISNIWVNGVAVYKSFPAVRMANSGRGRPVAAAGPPSIATEGARQRASRSGTPAGVIGAERLSILEEIKPEHIAEISYKDCLDTSIAGNFGNNALFIVLKPGIKYEVGFGSYPMDSPRALKKK